jgi:glutathione synthase
MTLAENAEILQNQIYFCQSKDIFTIKNHAYCHGQNFSISNRLEKQYKIIEEREMYNLNEFQIIMIRKNPPFNEAYLTMTHMLNLVDQSKTLIINNPKIFQTSSEKLLTLNFPEFIPDTLITGNIENAYEFLEKHNQIILKPINSYSSYDIFLINKGDYNIKVIFENLLQKYTNCPIIVQRFINNVTKGDKRVIIIDGEVIGSFSRIPKKGSILSGTVHDSSLELSSLTKKEELIVEKLKPFLIENKIYFAGIDIIDENLTEINFTSPTGIPILMELTGVNYGEKIWNMFEKIYDREIIKR